MTFDTHESIRTLKESGIPENQADAFREAHWEAGLATKTDLLEWNTDSSSNWAP
ncbi:hypothetical protein [Methylogaea oryzae]|uniref:Uncharacterized protein n=2 Tax=Methylogaea oryzae TaxID=1295382 RepID=A0A8D4VR11_9GAMM|nr:hypothetical protein [Methylogaea oryzae]BBL71014.1 hypothetical protein MoryE10_16200 [Methylogaea oryzae]